MTITNREILEQLDSECEEKLFEIRRTKYISKEIVKNELPSEKQNPT